jgi:bifunctional non-homologous end joining protein LigD
MQGDLKLLMHGKKIKGTYALFRLKKEEKSWLLVKKADEFASEEEVIRQNKSVKSGKTLAQVGKAEWRRSKASGRRTHLIVKKTQSPGIKKTGSKVRSCKKNSFGKKDSDK